MTAPLALPAPEYTHTPYKTVSRASLIKAFDLAKASGSFESKRLTRGLSIAQSCRMQILPHGVIDITNEDRTDFYLIHVNIDRDTVGACQCEDFKHNKVLRGENRWWCKHRIACALVVRAYKLDLEAGR